MSAWARPGRDHDDALTHGRRGRCAARQHRRADPPERLHQPETGRDVVRERVPGHYRAIVGRDPDRVGFGDQITDGQDEPIVADDDTAAAALGAEDRRGECVLGDIGTQRDNRIERTSEIEGELVGGRLQFGGKRPVL